MLRRRLSVKKPLRGKRATFGSRASVFALVPPLLIGCFIAYWVMQRRVLWLTSFPTPSDYILPDGHDVRTLIHNGTSVVASHESIDVVPGENAVVTLIDNRTSVNTSDAGIDVVPSEHDVVTLIDNRTSINTSDAGIDVVPGENAVVTRIDNRTSVVTADAGIDVVPGEHDVVTRIDNRTSVVTADEGIDLAPGENAVVTLTDNRTSVVIADESIDVLMPPHIDSLRSVLSSNSSFRFPSVEVRVRYYMGGWYDFQPLDITKHCPLMTFMDYPGKHNYCFLKSGKLFSRHYIVEKGRLGKPHNPHACTAHTYLHDVYEYLLPAFQDKNHNSSEPQRFLVRFGDLREQFPFPVFVKTRLARRMERDDPKFDPILAPLEMPRHFLDPLNHLKNGRPDRPWENKTSTLVWRGVSSGERLEIIDAFEKKFGLKGEKNISLTNSIDIGFNYLVYVDDEEKYEHLIKDELSIDMQLTHKYILNLEGNDVSTALKWNLLSNSVVFMPIPTCVSWAMEEILRPWYHYVPLQDDIMDLFEKMHWCMAHDAECKQISLHATQYMNDLWMSEQARIDGELVLQKMMSRYDLYGKMLEECMDD